MNVRVTGEMEGDSQKFWVGRQVFTGKSGKLPHLAAKVRS